MSFSVRPNKAAVSQQKGEQPEEKVLQQLGEEHMELINHGLKPELFYNGENWVYSIPHRIDKQEAKSSLQTVVNNSIADETVTPLSSPVTNASCPEDSSEKPLKQEENILP